jgi:hypothetical protein
MTLELPDDGRPLLLMDVDGVLNAANRSQNAKVYSIFKAGGSEPGKGFLIHFQHALNGWLAELADHFHLVWCTTWDDVANTALAPHLGLPTLPVIPTIEAEQPHHLEAMTHLPRMIHWKTSVVVAYVGKRPYAWIDDDFSPVDQGWAAARTRDIAPTYHLAIRSSAGLQRHHVDKLIAWAISLRGGE